MNSLYCKYIYEQKRIARLYMQSKSDDAEKDATQKKIHRANQIHL